MLSRQYPVQELYASLDEKCRLRELNKLSGLIINRKHSLFSPRELHVQLYNSIFTDKMEKEIRKALKNTGTLQNYMGVLDSKRALRQKILNSVDFAELPATIGK